MIIVRLPGVGGEEFAAAVHFVAYGRYVMLAASGSQETYELTCRNIAGKDTLDVPPQSLFGEKWLWKIHQLFEPQFFRNFLEKFLNALSPDFLQHLRFHRGNRIGYVGLDSGMFFRHGSNLQVISLSNVPI